MAAAPCHRAAFNFKRRVREAEVVSCWSLAKWTTPLLYVCIVASTFVGCKIEPARPYIVQCCCARRPVPQNHTSSGTQESLRTFRRNSAQAMRDASFDFSTRPDTLQEAESPGEKTERERALLLYINRLDQIN